MMSVVTITVCECMRETKATHLQRGKQKAQTVEAAQGWRVHGLQVQLGHFLQRLLLRQTPRPPHPRLVNFFFSYSTDAAITENDR